MKRGLRLRSQKRRPLDKICLVLECALASRQQNNLSRWNHFQRRPGWLGPSCSPMALSQDERHDIQHVSYLIGIDANYEVAGLSRSVCGPTDTSPARMAFASHGGL